MSDRTTRWVSLALVFLMIAGSLAGVVSMAL